MKSASERGPWERGKSRYTGAGAVSLVLVIRRLSSPDSVFYIVSL